MRALVSLLTLLVAPASALDVLVIDDGDSNTGSLEGKLRSQGHTVTNSWDDHAFVESSFDGDELDLTDWDAVIWLDGYTSLTLDMPEAGQRALYDYVAGGGGLLFGASGFQYATLGYNSDLGDLIPLRSESVDTASQTFVCIDDSHPVSEDWSVDDELELNSGVILAEEASTGELLFEVGGASDAGYGGVAAVEVDLGRSVQYALLGNMTRSYSEYETNWSDGDIVGLVEAGLQWVVQRPPDVLLSASWGVDAEGSVTLSLSRAFDPDGGEVELSWDVAGDGSIEGSSTSFVFSAGGYDGPTTEVVALIVTDDEGEESRAEATVSVRNVPPVITVTPSGDSVDEGQSVELKLLFSDVEAADSHTVSWDFGDGETGSGASVSHAWPDGGRYTVGVMVTDDDGASDAASFNQAVVNVAPTLSGEPSTSATVDIPWSFLPTVDEPGIDDILSFSSSGPPDVELDPTTGELSWIPRESAIGSHDLSLTVSDDDGGSDTLEWTVVVSALDVDGDGMSDPWEEEHGLDPTDPDDASADPDGDGRDNLDEFVGDTDPNTYEGPGQPGLLSPGGGEEVADGTPTLTLSNATAPLGQAVRYDFYVYSDADLSTLVVSYEGRGQGSGDTTSWNVTGAALTENHDYWWTAAAQDSHVTTPTVSPAESFFVNINNDPPVKPVVSTPFHGGIAESLSPELVLFATTDPDRDALTYTISLTDAAGTLLAEVSGLEADGATVGWMPDFNLVDETSYCWTGMATDDEGLDSAVSTEACFFIDLRNDPPSAPSIVSPGPDSFVQTLLPEIIVDDGVDPEGRTTVHEFQLDHVDSFDSEALQSGQVDTDDDGSTSWTPSAALDEDTVYFLRVRCNDGGAASDWVSASFTVSADNALPDAPTLLSPLDGHEVGGVASFTVGNVADPEGRAVAYDFLIVDRGGTTVAQIYGIDAGEDGQTTWASTGLSQGVYTWTARAMDEDGGASEWAPTATFAIVGSGGSEAGDGGAADSGATGAPGLVVAGEGCSCAASSRSGRASGALLLVVGALLGFARRRH